MWRLRVGRAAVVGQRRRREAQAGRLAVAHGPVGQGGRRLAVVCRRQVARGRRAAERAESAGRLRLLGEEAAPVFLEIYARLERTLAPSLLGVLRCTAENAQGLSEARHWRLRPLLWPLQ